MVFKYRPTILLLLALLFTACKKGHESKVDYSPGAVDKTSKEFLIPRELRENIEKDYLAFIRKENIKNVLPDAEILARIPREFLDINLFFKGSAPGVLSDNTEFKLPRGGGEIDLKNYIKGKKGTFYMSFSVKRSHSPEAPIRNLHIYFMSEAEARTIDNEKFGVGCQKYLDVSALLIKSNDDEGLQLNATEHRYLPVLGGVLYFVDFDPDRKIFVAAVRITDSRYPKEICPEPKN